jgi:hypothetical protein
MKTLLHGSLAGLLALSIALGHDEADYEITEAHRSLCIAMKHAISEEDTALCDILIKQGYQINKPIEAGSGRVALHEAVLLNKIVIIRHLLKAGADPLVRDIDDDRPVDLVRYRKTPSNAAMYEALERQPADHDKRMLMGIPVPVWREILGRPEQPHDPLAPPVPDMPDPALVAFVSINGEDPPAEMKRVLDAHNPGWRAASLLEHVERGASEYRDKNTKEFGWKLEITLVAIDSDTTRVKDSNPFDKRAPHSGPSAYEYKMRTATGDFLSGGGTRGRVVLVNGYWIKDGVQGWDE